VSLVAPDLFVGFRQSQITYIVLAKTLNPAQSTISQLVSA